MQRLMSKFKVEDPHSCWATTGYPGVVEETNALGVGLCRLILGSSVGLVFEHHSFTGLDHEIGKNL